MRHILVVASTFPASDTDSVPSFVKDQIIAMSKLDKSIRFSVLAPHDKRSHTKDFSKHKYYDEYRFHYAFPYSMEKLAGRGILPALQANPLNYLLVPVLFIGECIALYKLSRKLKPDLLYAHWFTPQAINARIVGSLTKTPFIFTTHASDVSIWSKLPFFGATIVRSNVRKARAFTAVSRRSMDKLARFFSPKEWSTLQRRSCIIPMGTEFPAKKDITMPSDQKSIIFLGRLAEKKGIQYLLPAIKEVAKQHPTIHLTIAGDGPLRDSLNEQVATLKIGEYVTFTGYITGKTKQELVATHSIYVVPSIITDSGDAEGLPVSLMEGLASGRICIATNESGADDILTNGHDGFLIPQRDSLALKDALHKALSLDDKKRKAISVNAQKTAQQFSWQSIARQHIDFLLKEKQ